MTLSVSTSDMQNRITAFNNTISRFNQIHQNLTIVFNTLVKVSWLSPAALALSKKILAKLAVFATMIRALQAQMNILQSALDQIIQVENLVTNKVESLRSTAFTS